MLLRCYCGVAAAAGGLHDVRGGYIYGRWFSLVFITFFAAAEDVPMPPKRATRGRTVALGKASKKTSTPTPSDDELDDGAAGGEDAGSPPIARRLYWR